MKGILFSITERINYALNVIWHLSRKIKCPLLWRMLLTTVRSYVVCRVCFTLYSSSFNDQTSLKSVHVITTCNSYRLIHHSLMFLMISWLQFNIFPNCTSLEWETWCSWYWAKRNVFEKKITTLGQYLVVFSNYNTWHVRPWI